MKSTMQDYQLTIGSIMRHGTTVHPADDYDTLQDTIAVLSDPELLTAHQEGRAANDAGDYLDADQLAHSMREAGRLPR